MNSESAALLALGAAVGLIGLRNCYRTRIGTIHNHKTEAGTCVEIVAKVRGCIIYQPLVIKYCTENMPPKQSMSSQQFADTYTPV